MPSEGDGRNVFARRAAVFSAAVLGGSPPTSVPYGSSGAKCQDDGVGMIAEARHFCMILRRVHKQQSGAAPAPLTQRLFHRIDRPEPRPANFLVSGLRWVRVEVLSRAACLHRRAWV